jgi:hypothetical protein
VDRFGLKVHFLCKHKRAVTGFYRTLSAKAFSSDTAIHYRKRFENYRDSLFTFLDHDGVVMRDVVIYVYGNTAILEYKLGLTHFAGDTAQLHEIMVLAEIPSGLAITSQCTPRDFP